jgi:long-chain acyl-CoA synthetase
MTTPTIYGIWNFSQWDGEKIALIDPNERQWSRRELVEEGNKIAHALRGMGLKKGDTVAAMLPNCAEYIALNLATMQIGLFLAPLNWHLAANEVSYILQDSDAKAFFYHSSTHVVADLACQSIGYPTSQGICISDDDNDNYRALIAGQPSQLPEDRIAGMVMYYTSGTTGNPKGVRRQVPNIDPDTNATNFTFLPMMFGIYPDGGNVHFCGSPLYHTAAMNWATASMHLGHCVVLHHKWDAENMLDAIERHKVTTTHVVPTQLVRLCKLPEDVKRRYDISSMTHIIHTAAPCPQHVKHEIIQWFGEVVYEYYASTEGGGTLVNSSDWLKYPGTVGKPWPTADVKIFDDEGNEMPAGQSGTIYMLMSELSRFEYKGDKEKTSKTQRGNYFTAGDIGYLNEEGYLFLSDRKIDMIISGGANIYPAEIESVLIAHPDVFDCCVFGIPNEDWGEEIRAAVQLRQGLTGDETMSQDILSFMQSRLAKMKLPKAIDYHQALPRDPNGKIYKRRLRDPFWEGRERNV